MFKKSLKNESKIKVKKVNKKIFCIKKKKFVFSLYTKNGNKILSKNKEMLQKKHEEQRNLSQEEKNRKCQNAHE